MIEDLDPPRQHLPLPHSFLGIPQVVARLMVSSLMHYTPATTTRTSQDFMTLWFHHLIRQIPERTHQA